MAAASESAFSLDMRATEFVQRLRTLIAEHGDRDIAVFDETGGEELPMGEIHALDECPEHEGAFLIVVRPE